MGKQLKRYSDTVEDRQTIDEFLDWCNEREISLGSYVKPFKDSDTERMAPIPKNQQELLDEYFDIDPAQLDKERRELLEQARKSDGD